MSFPHGIIGTSSWSVLHIS